MDETIFGWIVVEGRRKKGKGKGEEAKEQRLENYQKELFQGSGCM